MGGPIPRSGLGQCTDAGRGSDFGRDGLLAGHSILRDATVDSLANSDVKRRLYGWPRSSLASVGGLDHADLRERREDDPRCGSKVGLGDLDHRHVALAQLEDAPAGAGRRVVYALGQLDDVEGGDFVSYSHEDMLGARVGGGQPWGGAEILVVPAHGDHRAPLVDRHPLSDSADDSKPFPVAYLHDCRGASR